MVRDFAKASATDDGIAETRGIGQRDDRLAIESLLIAIDMMVVGVLAQRASHHPRPDGNSLGEALNVNGSEESVHINLNIRR